MVRICIGLLQIIPAQEPEGIEKEPPQKVTIFRDSIAWIEEAWEGTGKAEEPIAKPSSASLTKHSGKSLWPVAKVVKTEK